MFRYDRRDDHERKMRPPKSAPRRTPATEHSLWLGMRIPMLLAVVLICAFFARLIGINQAFVDKNSWRQADVAMIAQNFFNGGYDILHPQIDWSADTTGVVGTEFPLLPLLAALLYNLFGLHDWIGRLIPVIFFCASMPFFFLLVRRLSDTETGLLALAFYAFAPLGIVISRSFMPDAVALSLAVIGLYFILIWVDSMRLAHLGLAAWFVSGTILVKAPYAMVLLPIVYVTYRRFGWKAISIKPLWGFAIVALLPSVLWYVHAPRIPTAILAIGEKPIFLANKAWAL